MSNIENRDISLQELVRNIDKNCYHIPKFQRDFVWDTSNIEALGDSIIRRYPISSVLLMPRNGTLKVGSHPIVDNKETVDKELEYYILDGQQRITSISKLFLAMDDKFEYYFDLLSMLSEKYPSDNILNDAGVKEKLLKSHPSEILCRKFPIGKDKNEQVTRQNNRFISGKRIVEDKFGAVVAKFLREFKDASDDAIDKYHNYLSAELGKVSTYSIPATVIASDSELGVVIRVFEKVNSTGKKLTIFDLINAKSFQTKFEKYKVGLSDYLTDAIKTFNLNVGKNFRISDEYDFQDLLPRIVRIFEVAKLLSDGKTPALSQASMLMREPDFWFEMWNQHAELLKNIMKWFNDEELVNIGQVTFLEYASAIFLANPKAFELPKFKDEIKKYALYLTLAERNFSKSDLETVTSFNEMASSVINTHASDRDKFKSLYENPNVSTEKILKIEKSKGAFFAIINIIYNQNFDSLGIYDIAGNQIKKMDNMDYHHLYPSSRTKVKNSTKQEKEIFNSIANIVCLCKISNREDFKDKLPSEYMLAIKAKNLQSTSWCKSNLIDLNKFIELDSEEKAEEFLKDRASKIAYTVNSYFN